MANERRGDKHQLVCRLEGLCGIMERGKEGDSKRRCLKKTRRYKSERRGGRKIIDLKMDRARYHVLTVRDTLKTLRMAIT